MQLMIGDRKEKPVFFHPGLPEEFERYKIGIATSWYAIHPKGKLMAQIISYDLFSIWSITGIFTHDTVGWINFRQTILPLIFTLGKPITLHLQDGQKVAMSTGQFLLLRLTPATYKINLDLGTFRFLVLEINTSTQLSLQQVFPSWMVQDLARTKTGGLYANACFNTSITAGRRLERIVGSNKDGVLGKIFIEAEAKKLFLESVYQIDSERPKIPLAHDLDLYDKIKAFINGNLEKKLTIKLICDEFKLSRAPFCSTFQNLTSKSVHQYITDQRIEKAKRILLKERLPVSEAGAIVGMPETSNFSRTFKRITGLTPTEYINLELGTD